jgi:hypothetical protein
MSWRQSGGVEVWLHSVLTSAADGSEWSRHSPAALPPRKKPGRLSLEVEAGWAPEPVWMCFEVRKSWTGIRATIRAACSPVAVPTAIPLPLHNFPWGVVGVFLLFRSDSGLVGLCTVLVLRLYKLGNGGEN